MGCDKTTQVQAYYDRELPPAETASMRTHIQACAECRDLLTELKQLSELVASAALAEMPAQTFARLQGNWREVVGDRAVMRIASWLTAAAAAILVGALLLGRQATTELAHVSTWQTAAVMAPP